MKKIISAALAGCMLLSAMPVLASDINITIDGEKFIPKNALGEVVEPFIENGSTFLPVRAMGEAVGKEVSFDAENYAVYIGTRPMEADVKREPVLLVGDKVFYLDIVNELNIDYILNGEKAIKKAKELFTEEKITEVVSGYAESTEMMIKQYGEESREAVEYMVYVSVCSEMLLSNDEFLINILENLATVKHILVEDELVAKEIIEKIEKGATFEDLIEEYNTDPGQSRDSSYTFSYGEMVAEFEKAAFELKEGEISEPVKSQFGYHIIKRLPLDSESAMEECWNTAFNKAVEKIELDRVVYVVKEGNYGRINSVVYTTDMLKRVNKLFTGDDTFFLYTDAFEYAQILSVINIIAREKGVIETSGETFDLEKEIADFEKAYEALFAGELTPSDEEVYSAYDKIEAEIFDTLKVFVDGKLIVPCDVNGTYVEPKNVNGTVYVPVRAIVEALGMKADWDNDTRTVVIVK